MGEEVFICCITVTKQNIILTSEGSSLRANRDVLCSNVLMSGAADVCQSFLIPDLLLRSLKFLHFLSSSSDGTSLLSRATF